MPKKTLILIAFLAAAIAAPFAISAIHKRNVARWQRECLNNLTWIDSAKFMAAKESGLKPGTATTEAYLAPYIVGGWRDCPAGGTYTINVIGKEPACSIPSHKFVKEIRPAPP
jgi:hypothetical protein